MIRWVLGILGLVVVLGTVATPPAPVNVRQIVIRNANDCDNVPQPAGCVPAQSCGMEPTLTTGVLCGPTNTGIAGKGLTNGDMTSMAAGVTTANGQTITRRIINGDLCIIHNNVTITESVINGSVYVGRRNQCSGSGDVAVSGLIIQDSTINGSGALEGINDITGTNSIYRRNDISRVQNFFTIWTGTTVQILSNYGHSEAPNSGSCGNGSDIHWDGIEAYEWVTSLSIRNNTILQEVCSTGATSPMNITPLGGTPNNLLVEYNLFRSMNSAYVILIDNTQGASLQTATFTGNRLWATSGGGYFYQNGGNNALWGGSGNCQITSLTTTCGATVPVP